MNTQTEEHQNTKRDEVRLDLLRDIRSLQVQACQMEALAAKRLRLAFSDLLGAEKCRIYRIKMQATGLVSDLRYWMASLLRRRHSAWDAPYRKYESTKQVDDKLHYQWDNEEHHKQDSKNGDVCIFTARFNGDPNG